MFFFKEPKKNTKGDTKKKAPFRKGGGGGTGERPTHTKMATHGAIGAIGTPSSDTGEAT